MVSMGGIGDVVLSLGIILISGILAAAVIGAIFYFIKKGRRFKEYDCVIWGKDGFGQVYEKHDKAGVFVDSKTNNKRFFLKKCNVGLNADKIPFIQSGNKKIVYLHQFGLKNFRFINPKLHDDQIAIEVGEEDVNWAINSYERGKKVFNSDKLLQYLPYIALAFVSLIILIMFIYLFKQFENLKAFGDALVTASENARAGLSPTQII